MTQKDYAYFCELKRRKDLLLLRQVTGYKVAFNPRKSWEEVREPPGPPSCWDPDSRLLKAAFQGIFPMSKTISVDVFCAPNATADKKQRIRAFLRTQLIHEYCHVLAATPEEKTQPNLGLVAYYPISDQELAATILTREIIGSESIATNGLDLNTAENEIEISSRIDPVRYLIPLLQEIRK